MNTDFLPHMGRLVPLAMAADPVALACYLDRLADHALATGRSAYAEKLARHAATVREGAL